MQVTGKSLLALFSHEVKYWDMAGKGCLHGMGLTPYSIMQMNRCYTEKIMQMTLNYNI